MKAITVRQPWAWAIAAGQKTVENRTQGSSYRGWLAIHAGQGWSTRGAADPRVDALARHDPHLVHWVLSQLADQHRALGSDWPGFHRGAVIAVAQLVDTHADTGCCRPWGESSYAEAGGRTRTAIHHLVLDDIRPLPIPVPARGALGLWTPDADLLDALGAAA